MPKVFQVQKCQGSILRECLLEVSGHFTVVRMRLRGPLFRINVKLGGINAIPAESSVSVLTDPRKPTIVMGASLLTFD